MTEFRRALSTCLSSRRAASAVLVALVLILAGCTGGGGGGGMDMGDNESGNMTMTDMTLNESELATFENQTTDGTTVTVQTITVPDGGYAMIHNMSLKDNMTRSAIGVSEYLEPGTHHNVTVTLFNVPGRGFSEDATLMEDQRLLVMPHRETNDNQQFDHFTTGMNQDGAYRNETGAIAVDFAVVTVEDDEMG